MSTCSTSRGVARALALGAGLVCAGSAGGEELEWRGEATAGLRLYHFSSPFDDDDQVSFFDQYRQSHPRWSPDG